MNTVCDAKASSMSSARASNDRQQVAVTTLEILEDIGQLAGCRLRIQPQDTVDDMIRPCLVGWVEIAWFGRRLEWAHDHPGRIRAQIESCRFRNVHL